MSLDDVRKRVAARRRLARLGDSPSTAITLRDAEALCDLADAANEYRQVALDGERSSAGDHCTRCGCEWPCPTERIRAALARLDGETGG